MNPHIIKLIVKGHEEKMKQQDYMNWLNNQYTLSAVSVAVEHCLAGKKAKSQYVEKSFLQEYAEENQSGYKESKEEVAIFEMKQRINLLRQSGLPESPL